MNREFERISKMENLAGQLGDSFFPSLFGFGELKEALLLQLFGCRYSLRPTRREEIHILLLGEHGAPIPQILSRVGEIAQKREIIIDTLTGKTVQDAKNGLFIVEDLGRMAKNQQETISHLMQASPVSILAGAMPECLRFEPYKPVGEQYNIIPEILSQNDLIIPVRDILDSELDKKKVCDVILENEGLQKEKPNRQPIKDDLLKEYIQYARENIQPVLKSDSTASETLQEYYCTLRDNETLKATPRVIGSMIRLSEAFARMRLSDEVLVEDVEGAYGLIDYVIGQLGRG